MPMMWPTWGEIIMTVLRLFDLPKGEISTVRLVDTDQYIREV